MTAWHGMLNWKAVSWIKPQQSIRIHLPDGNFVLSSNLRSARLSDQKKIAAAHFDAVLLPEHLLLRTTLNVPKLPTFELNSALSLQAQSLSPFPKSDITWSYEIISAAANSQMMSVELVMTSRKLVVNHIASAHPALKLQNSEVLNVTSSGRDYRQLPGFGEAFRLRRGRIWIWVNISLIIVAMGLVTAMAVTPSVQLFFRFMQGYRAMFELQGQAAPVMAQRESFVRTGERLANLSDIVGKSAPSLQTLTLLTQALPDDTSLLNLQIKDSKVSISGQTVNAAALMKSLDSTPGLHDVRAPSPATKPIGATRESFSIEFMLDPAQIKSAP